jgi:hypothetical protein
MMLAVSPTTLASFKVFPTLIDVKRPAGRAVSGTFNVDLKGERGRRFAVSVQDVVQQPNGTYAYENPSRSPFSASTWTTVSPTAFSGSPDRTQPAVTQAKRVLKYRDERGFSSLDDLDEIPGLPQSYLNELKEKLTL